jgi:hypothetical protein
MHKRVTSVLHVLSNRWIVTGPDQAPFNVTSSQL